MKKCAYCRETISPEAETGPHCDADLVNKRQSTQSNSSSTRSIVFTVIAVLGGGLVLVVVLLVALLLPAIQHAREAVRRSQCANNLRHIAMALATYQETYGSFPPAYTVDANGKPLHSWRVLIAPFLDEAIVSTQQIDLNEPWDSPKNSQFHSQIPNSYQCPSNPRVTRGMTHYLGIVGEQCALRPGNGSRLADCTDDPSNTLIISESNTPVNWMEPRDISFESLTRVGDPKGVSGSHAPGNIACVLVVGGAVHFVSDAQNVDLKALSTVAGGEAIHLNSDSE